MAFSPVWFSDENWIHNIHGISFNIWARYRITFALDCTKSYRNSFNKTKQNLKDKICIYLYRWGLIFLSSPCLLYMEGCSLTHQDLDLEARWDNKQHCWGHFESTFLLLSQPQTIQSNFYQRPKEKNTNKIQVYDKTFFYTVHTFIRTNVSPAYCQATGTWTGDGEWGMEIESTPSPRRWQYNARGHPPPPTHPTTF